jgi:hypothetical protein
MRPVSEDCIRSKTRRYSHRGIVWRALSRIVEHRTIDIWNIRIDSGAGSVNEVHKRRWVMAILGVTLVGQSNITQARVLECGKAPPLSNEETRVDLRLNAQALLKNVSGSVGGAFQTSRAEVLSRYPNADRLLVDSFYQWEICTLANDPKLTTAQRLKIVSENHKEFRRPITSLHLKTVSGPSKVQVPMGSPPGQVAINVPGTAINSFGNNANNTIVVTPSNPLTRREYLPALQEFYTRGRQIETMARSRDLTDEQIIAINHEGARWPQETLEWIESHMTSAAAADFATTHEEFGTEYQLIGAHPERIQGLFNWLHMSLPQHLNNLRFLMTSDAMDPQK